MTVLHSNAEIVLGPPGTGKTTTMIKIVNDLLNQGLFPNEIAYLAFTRKAAEEAISRALEKFPMYLRSDFPYFRTIHSLCFRQLGLSRQQVVQKHHLVELGDLIGLDIRGNLGVFGEGEFESITPGDKAVFIESVARNRKIPVRDQWEETDNGLLELAEVDLFARSLFKFKDSRGLIDYTDMLEQFCLRGIRPKIRALIIDEAQDLSLLQWDVIRIIAEKCDVVYIAGDDDQSIYRWAGAATEYFIGIDGRTRCLSRSFRTPRAVKIVADDIISRIKNRRSKLWESTDNPGSVTWLEDIDSLPIATTPGSWFLLGRNTYLLKEFEEKCLEDGLPYITHTGRVAVKPDTIHAIRVWTRMERGHQVSSEEIAHARSYMSNKSPGRGIWHEALDKIPLREREFLIAALRREERITDLPRIKIGTIHSVKGGECDNVAIMLDMARQTYDGYETEPTLYDDENRTFYVGVTRAKQNVFFIAPATSQSFEV